MYIRVRFPTGANPSPVEAPRNRSFFIEFGTAERRQPCVTAWDADMKTVGPVPVETEPTDIGTMPRATATSLNRNFWKRNRKKTNEAGSSFQGMSEKLAKVPWMVHG